MAVIYIESGNETPSEDINLSAITFPLHERAHSEKERGQSLHALESRVHQGKPTGYNLLS